MVADPIASGTISEGGGADHVVDDLLAQTRGEALPQEPETTVPALPTLLNGYRCTGYDGRG